MKEINLTQGKVALVDDEDFEYLNQWKWFAYRQRDTYYVGRTVHFKDKSKKNVRMHRVIMNTPEELEVDHIDHNGLNNQKSNLRNCTTIQNQMNRVKHSGTSKFKGVCVRKNGRITANIRVDKKLIHIGDFDCEFNAACAYDFMAKRYFGEYANLNFNV